MSNPKTTLGLSEEQLKAAHDAEAAFAGNVFCGDQKSPFFRVGVPLEATNEMIDAALAADGRWSIHSIERLRAAYRAMIAARPR